MRSSKALRLLIAFVAMAAALGACSYGDPCLRTTDCNSGFICSEGLCVVDLGDNPSDASSPQNDVTTPTDTTVSKDNVVSTDPDAESGEGSATDGDPSGPDTKNDVSIDSVSTDAPRDVSGDASDGRVSVDSATTGDAGGDVGSQGDSSDARDASDAPG
jgi:hypothetical protein